MNIPWWPWFTAFLGYSFAIVLILGGATSLLAGLFGIPLVPIQRVALACAESLIAAKLAYRLADG